MNKGGKNDTLRYLDILVISWLSVTSKKRQMAEGSEFRSGIRLPDGWDVRAYMGDVSTPTGLVARSGGGERAYMGDVGTPAKGNLADNQ